MEGLGNEVPFFVLRYKPDWEPKADEELARLCRRLRKEGYRLADVDVFALAVGIWKKSPVFEQMLSMEAQLDPEVFRAGLRGVIDVEGVLAPAIKKAVDEAGGEGSVYAILLSGVHHLFLDRIISRRLAIRRWYSSIRSPRIIIIELLTWWTFRSRWNSQRTERQRCNA